MISAVTPLVILLSMRQRLSSAFRLAARVLKRTFSKPPKIVGGPSDEPRPDELNSSDPPPEQAPEPSIQAEVPPHSPEVAGQTPDAVLRGFTGRKSMRRWQNQMMRRGWTARQIEEAIHNGRSYPAENRINPSNGATRYVHPKTGRSAVIDDTTGQVIQLGGDGFDHD